MSFFTRLFVGFVLTVALLVGMTILLPTHIAITGGFPAFLIAAAVLTLLNLFAHPVLDIITFPIRLLFTLIAIVFVNVVFLWLLVIFTNSLNPALVHISITGGIDSWLIVSTVLGIGHWILKHVPGPSAE